MKKGTKVISIYGNHKGEVTEVTDNNINIRYQSGNEVFIHKSKFNKMFKEI